MTILNDIVSKTQEKLLQQKQHVSLSELQKTLGVPPYTESRFAQALRDTDIAIIAEIKKASPSAGVICADFQPVQIAKDYLNFGAAAISVLTEEDFFQGSPEDLQQVKTAVDLPILRKDFIIDSYQIYASKAMGADCILLIASILDDSQLQEFSQLAELLKLDYIIEVHTIEELKRAEQFSKAIIGVNNRDLRTFTVDLENSVNLKAACSTNNIFVAESGIKTLDDMHYLASKGINNFLIGESLMRGSFHAT